MIKVEPFTPSKYALEALEKKIAQDDIDSRLDFEVHFEWDPGEWVCMVHNGHCWDYYATYCPPIGSWESDEERV